MTPGWQSATQRATVVAELPRLLREMGASPAEVFAGTGIDPDALAPDARLPFTAIVALLARAAAATGCAHLGLLLGLRFRLAHHGPIGRLMLAAPTLHDALADFVAWQPGYSSGAIAYLSTAADTLAVGYGVYDPAAPDRRQLYDLVAAIGTRMVAELSGGRIEPLEIQIAARRHDDAAIHARLLRVPVRFDQPGTCMLIDGRAARTPRAEATAEARQAALAEVRAAMPAAFDSIALRTRHILRPLLQSGRGTMPAVAAALGLHPRTLRRRLAAEGTTFEALRDTVRFAMAREFLEMTGLPVGEIGLAVGFASPGVFTEAFRLRNGASPLEWRSARREAPARDP